MTAAKPYRHRLPMTIIQHAVWRYHRFPLSSRDVQELLHQRGLEISHETLREWCLKFGPQFTDELRRGSRWLLDEVCTAVDGVRYWLWRAVDEHGFVLDVFLQRYRDTQAAKIFLSNLLGEYDVPDTICTDQLRSYRAAIRAFSNLVHVNHQQVISGSRCNNMVQQSHGSTRRQSGSNKGFKRRRRAQEFLRLHAWTLTSTITPARAFPPRLEEATRNRRSTRGQWLPQGWPEPQATPALRLPRCQLRQHNPRVSMSPCSTRKRNWPIYGMVTKEASTSSGIRAVLAGLGQTPKPYQLTNNEVVERGRILNHQRVNATSCDGPGRHPRAGATCWAMVASIRALYATPS